MAILIELAEMLPARERHSFYTRVEQLTTSLKVNSASARPVRAVRELTIPLAKIIGAFMADGSLSAQAVVAASQESVLKDLYAKREVRPVIRFSKARNQYYIAVTLSAGTLPVLTSFQKNQIALQTHYTIDLVEEYRDSVEAFIQWMMEVFSISPTLFVQHRHAWRVVFPNKIVARYFMRYFEIVPGQKTLTAHEPTLIRESSLPFRRAFAQGVLMFDGSVNTTPAITLGTKSELLWHSIRTILALNGVRTSSCKKNNRDEWVFATIAHTPLHKLAAYFAPHTQKHKLLLWMFGDMNQTPVIRTGNRISTEKIVSFLQTKRQCDIGYLMSHFGVKRIVVQNLVNILERQGRLRITKKPRVLGSFVSGDASVSLRNGFHKELFSKARRMCGKDKNASAVLGADKATYSAWKCRRNRIPLRVVRKLCLMTDTEPERAKREIESIDRMILEISVSRKNVRRQELAAS